MVDTSQEALTVIYEPPSTGIRIIIDKLLNIKNRRFPFEVNIKVEFMDTIIGELNDVKVENEESNNIGSEIYYKITKPVTREILDDLTANPFLITVNFKGDISDKKARQKKHTQKSPKQSKKLNKSPKSSKTSKESTVDVDKQDVKMQQYFGILGQTNLDVLPLLMGEAKLTEVLILESTQKNTGSSITASANLPHLTVSAEPISDTMEDVTPHNILYFTLEAMYNVMPELQQPGASCEAYTALPLLGCSAEEYVLVTFTNYEIETSPVSENNKRWLDLSRISGRSAISKYRLNDDILDIKNTVQVNLNEKLSVSSPRLEWNTLRRCWIQENTEKEIFEKLVKYRCWPVEFKIRTTEPKGKTSPKKGKSKEKKETSSEESKNHFIAFLDISNLLYPGVTQTRVTGQLYTYTNDEMKKRFGRDYAFTSPPPPSLSEQLDQLQSLDQLSKSQRYQYDSKAQLGTRNKLSSNSKNESQKSNRASRSLSKDKSQRRSKGKSDEKASANKDRTKSAMSRPQKPEEIQALEPPQDEQISVPVFTQDGQPVFVIVEVQLERPLKQKRTKEEIKSCITDLIPPRPEPDPLVVDAQTAEANYKLCIQNIINVIEEQYELFVSREAPLPENIEKNFLMHLHQTGGYRQILETLRESVLTYVRNKIGLPKSDITECEYQLVEEMFRIVNSTVDRHTPKNAIYDPGVTADNLYYYAVEAWEQSNYDRAKVYLLEVLAGHYINSVVGCPDFQLCCSWLLQMPSNTRQLTPWTTVKNADSQYTVNVMNPLRLDRSNKMDPQHWIDYGVFCVLQTDYEKAHECVREALSLDIRHKNSLLFHALFSWLTEDYKEAELFFTAVITFYPYFPEAWFAFKLFAEETEQPYVVSVAYIAGMKCLRSSIHDRKDSGNDSTVLLSWSPISENNKPFLLTAVLMLKFGFPELAEHSLSSNLSEQAEPTAAYLYLLAVSHYMQGRYEESNRHLTQATHLDWEDSYIWILMGHNYYKMGQKQEAQNAYKFVIDSVNRPIDIPLTYLRYGLCLMEGNDYLDAKEMFLLACTHGPSPLSWLGLGSASYMLSDMEDAEMALSEANMLDNRLAEVWAYLALINLHTCHKDRYEHCYAQAKMYGLNDAELLNKIHTLESLVLL